MSVPTSKLEKRRILFDAYTYVRTQTYYEQNDFNIVKLEKNVHIHMTSAYNFNIFIFETFLKYIFKHKFLFFQNFSLMYYSLTLDLYCY